MTITNSSTRLAALVAGVAVALALMGAVAVAPAQAAGLSAAQVQAIVSLLASFGADSATINNVTAALNGQATTGTGGTNGGVCPVLTRSLQLGSSGADVMSLQKFLNGTAATRVSVSGAGSPGMETTYFGPATQSAVVKFQAANSVSAIGVVGPATRAAIAAVCGTTGGNTGGNTGGTDTSTLKGGEGQLDINDQLGDVESDIDEGDSDVQVLGVELEAKDSDVAIERVDVDVTLSGTGSTRLTNYFDSVSLMLDGKVMATIDAGDVEKDSGTVYSFRFTNLKNNIIREDDMADLYVVVDAVSNVDAGDVAKAIKVAIPVDGIRAVDAAGISDTYDSSAYDEENINVVEATSGDLELSEGDNNPNGQVVTVDEEDDTTDVLALDFDIEAKNQDVTVDALPVHLVTTQGSGATGVDSQVKRAILKKGSTVLDTISIAATTSQDYIVVFDNLNLDINKGDTETLSVYVDLNNTDTSGAVFATGTTMYSKVVGSDGGWDVEDSSGDNVTPSGSVNNSGELLVFQTEGISVKLVSVDEVKTFEAGAVAGQKDIGQFKIVVDITAVGEDMYIDKSATRDTTAPFDGSGSAGNGFIWATTTESTTGTTSVSSTVTASGSTSSDSTNNFKINDGETRRFTLTVSLESGIDGVAAVQLYGINWSKTDSATDANFYTSNMSDFKTDLLTLLTQ